MADPDAERLARAAVRRAEADRWAVRVYRLGEEPARDPLDTSTADERVAWMWTLAKEAWHVSGQTIPTYSRDQMPGVVLRRGI